MKTAIRTASQIIGAAVESYRIAGNGGIEAAWDATYPTERRAVSRRITSLMGRAWVASQDDPFNKFLAFVEACAAGSPIRFAPAGTVPIGATAAGEATPPPSPWDRPFRLIAAVREDQRDWSWSRRQVAVAEALGVPDPEPPPRVAGAEVAPSASGRDPASAPAPARTIGIGGGSYRVAPLAIHPGIGSHAFEVRDIDRGHVHHLYRDIFGTLDCSCGDFQFRRAGRGDRCKHLRRFVEIGLIPAPGPTTPPPSGGRSGRTGAVERVAVVR